MTNFSPMDATTKKINSLYHGVLSRESSLKSPGLHRLYINYIVTPALIISHMKSVMMANSNNRMMNLIYCLSK